MKWGEENSVKARQYYETYRTPEIYSWVDKIYIRSKVLLVSGSL